MEEEKYLEVVFFFKKKKKQTTTHPPNKNPTKPNFSHLMFVFVLIAEYSPTAQCSFLCNCKRHEYKLYIVCTLEASEIVD